MGLEKHMLNMTDLDAYPHGNSSYGAVAAVRHFVMSESAANLQKQLDALASFCEERHFTVNLSNTKVVVFER